ncbi:hypothetical protein Bsph_2570 [Lysinibacillus sphaericus C3-41]|uniref:Uncharacterized protein n=1 Tax=Lysinibacillus sphaericus (strain C3-41) TaxID=444177 RepID=B1HYG0_LYSSC|nr:hypothetical protein Bsph_2570 [Lysinibacillus sphaericus C3-41]
MNSYMFGELIDMISSTIGRVYLGTHLFLLKGQIVEEHFQ